MTEIEDTLSRVLTAEAGRHEPPVFDARRIAEGAVRRKLWRRPLFAVVAGTIAVAGGGGAAVFAAASGHSSGGRVAVIFQNDGFAKRPIPLVDGTVDGWLQQTIAAEGLKDTVGYVGSDSVRIVVDGRAADLPKLKALLGTPVVLQFRQVQYVSTPPAPSGGEPQCVVSTVETGGAGWKACDRHNSYTWVASREAIDYHVVSAQAEPPAAGADHGAGGWRVAVRLDPESGRMLAGVARNGGGIAVMVDGTVHDVWHAEGLNPAGVLTIDGGYTEQEARTLAARLSQQGPPGVEGTVVTVHAWTNRTR